MPLLSALPVTHPFPGMPYVSAPDYSFPAFEVCAYILFAFCLAHAIKKGRLDVAYLIGGLCFGLLLEYVNVVANMGYTYGRFTVMLGRPPLDIPICIGIGWAVIMYSARLFTDTFGLPLWASAAMDTLLAISIDLSMDTVAYRLDMWHWNWTGTGLDPLTADWFGIPYGNFFGWLCVIFFYSAFCRLLERWLGTGGKSSILRSLLVPFLSVLLSQVFLYVTLACIDVYLRDHFGITAKNRFYAAVPMLIITLMYGWRKRISAAPAAMPLVTWLVPAFSHVFFFVYLLLEGYYKENGWMLVPPLVIIAISFVLHLKKKSNVMLSI